MMTKKVGNLMATHPQIRQARDFLYFHTVSGSCDIAIHTHDVYEIFLCVSDNINYYIEGNIYELNKYDMVITNNKESHRPFLRTKGTYERRIIQIRPDYLTSFCISDKHPFEAFERRKSCEHNIIKASDVLEHKLIDYIMEIDKYTKKHSAHDDIMVKTLLLQLIIKLNEIIYRDEYKEKKSSKSDRQVVAIKNYIREHLDKSINLDMLANAFFINKYYLCHLFKKHVGISIMEYIHLKRIEKAKHLLLEGVPVIQVCYLVGFNDYSNFYKRFKKLVGLSPKKYIEDFTQLSGSHDKS